MLLNELDSRCGAFTVVRCGGLSPARVWKVVSEKLTLIIKEQPSPSEGKFYKSVAPHLREIGIGIPELEFITEDRGQFWLVLEWLPLTLPSTRWVADSEVMRILSILHSVQSLNSIEGDIGYSPTWPQEWTTTGLQYFPPEIRATMRPILEDLRNRASFLFTSECWISGDPNPTNWGLRDNQTLALFDWERFGRGTPALDLAITIPGFGDFSQYRMVACGYLAARDRRCPFSSTVDELARQIGLAKAWSVIEFLGLHANGCIHLGGQHIKAIQGTFPRWLFETGLVLSKS